MFKISSFLNTKGSFVAYQAETGERTIFKVVVRSLPTIHPNQRDFLTLRAFIITTANFVINYSFAFIV